jgi:hypothetical protein
MNYYLQNNAITFVLCQMQICRLAQRGVLKGLVPYWILDEAGARPPIATATPRWRKRARYREDRSVT